MNTLLEQTIELIEEYKKLIKDLSEIMYQDEKRMGSLKFHLKTLEDNLKIIKEETTGT